MQGKTPCGTMLINTSIKEIKSELAELIRSGYLALVQ
jgi:hypothetical protein